MITTKPISPEWSLLISGWYCSDTEGKKRIGAYANVEQWLKLLDNNSRWGFIVFDDETPVGFLDLERMEKGKGAFTFYVAPNFRGKGYSQLLVTELIKIAKEKKIGSLYAGIEEDNTASINALEKVGFAEVGRDKDNMREFELDITYP